MHVNKKTVALGALLALIIALVVSVVVGGPSNAAALITGRDIKNESVTGADIKPQSLGLKKFSPFVANRILNPHGKPGTNGTDGEDGHDGVFGAYYSQAFYNVGDTNAGAIATVACSNVTDVALSGGVEVLGLDAGANSRNTPVSSSFPGRMNWDTNTPREGRLDGWIVQFGGNAGEVSDKAPEKVRVWALCLPGADIPVVETFNQAG